jgi:predicted restriction endonuclease
MPLTATKLTAAFRAATEKPWLAQTFFRSNLLKLWDGACAVTGVSDPRVLRASHIKPWKDSSNEEKLDRNNGLLLIPDLDVLFDEGLITFQTDGAMSQSPSFAVADQRKMRIDRSFRLRHVTEEMQPYLEYHREQRFVC